MLNTSGTPWCNWKRLVSFSALDSVENKRIRVSRPVSGFTAREAVTIVLVTPRDVKLSAVTSLANTHYVQDPTT